MKVILTVSSDTAASEASANELIRLAKAAPHKGCAINFVSGLIRPKESSAPSDLHAIVEMWLDDDTEPDEVAQEFVGSGEVAGYLIDEVVQKQHSRPDTPGFSAGVSGIYLVRRTPELSLDEFADHWNDIHGPLALRVHWGMSGYSQNTVRGRFLAADELLDGFSKLHFPSEDDQLHKMYRDEAGKVEVGADTRSFVGSSIGYRTREYSVLAP